MTRLHSLPDMVQSLLLLVNLLILIVDIYCVILGWVFGSGRIYRFFNGALTVLTSVLFCLSGMDYYNRYMHSGNPGFSKEIFNKPVAVIVILLMLLGGLSLASLFSVNNWKKNYVTPASIKEGMDKLPSGLCYHNEAGIPKLINHRMDNLCRYITGEPLFDGNEFWRRLINGEVIPGNTVEKSGDNPIITISGGETVSFTRAEKEISGEKMYEIRAADITKQFALYNELQKSNNNLRQLNARLQEYGENVWDITREREILSAKVHIHDTLGKSLLITRRYIENGDIGLSKEDLIEIWKANVALFSGGFEGEKDDNSLEELYKAAEIMGIHLKVTGSIPKDNQVLRFVMSGARESLTNAVHHARASELTISLSYSFGFCVIEYTNDGIQPECGISEGGGLSSLRERVENADGIMETEIYPQFVLRLKIPSKEAL